MEAQGAVKVQKAHQKPRIVIEIHPGTGGIEGVFFIADSDAEELVLQRALDEFLACSGQSLAL